MRKVSCLFALALLAAIAVAATPSTAPVRVAARVTGGGTGLFIDPSVTPTDMGLTTNFAVGLTVHSDGSATGHFTCLIPGIVVIDGDYTAGSYDAGTGVATASGNALLVFPGGGFLVVTFTNTFKAGGPGVGEFTLTDDSGYFDVAPFLDTEVVLKGTIKIK